MTLLREAAEKLPENPLVQYHFGMAQYHTGDHAGARRSLEQALNLKPEVAAAADARSTLREL